MRLLTHNLLQCHVRSCTSDNFPLAVQDAVLVHTPVDFNPSFVARLIPKLHWPALVHTAISLGIVDLPESLPESPDEDTLSKIHKVLLETRIKEGSMVCQGCKHIYPIIDGIPNMLLQDHEV